MIFMHGRLIFVQKQVYVHKWKKVLIDPPIAVASLNLSPRKLENDLNTLGFLFENLCIHDLNVYTISKRGVVSYYADRFGLEVDCVLHLRDGRYALIEFKLGSKEIDKGAANLLKINNLINQNDQMQKPCFLAIITGGKFAYTREDGIKIIPIGCLRYYKNLKKNKISIHYNPQS